MGSTLQHIRLKASDEVGCMIRGPPCRPLRASAQERQGGADAVFKHAKVNL